MVTQSFLDRIIEYRAFFAFKKHIVYEATIFTLPE